MPKIFQTSWLVVLLATVIYYLIGFAWYGFFFKDAWQAANGISAAAALARAEELGVMMLVWGFLITLGQAIGLLMVLHLAGVKRLGAGLNIAFWLSLTLIATLLANDSLYKGYSLDGFLIEFGHVFIGFLAMAAIFAYARRVIYR